MQLTILKKMILLAMAAALMMLPMGVAFGEAELPEEAAMDAAAALEESIPLVEIKIDAYELTYSDLLAEDILCTPVDETPEVDFLFSLLPEGTVLPEEESEAEAEIPLGTPLFTMTLDSDVGDVVTVLTNEAGAVLPVSFTMAEAPEEMEEAELAVFYLKQGEVNIILDSLVLVAAPERVAEAGVPVSEQIVVASEPEPVKVSMEGYEFSYPAALTELLEMVETEAGELEFRALTSEEALPVFTLRFNSTEGQMVIMLGETPVAFQMEMLPEGVSDADANTFYMAQEAVNEIVGTIVLK